MEKKRAQWSSKLGFILAAAGSAIGLGNIWKFPGRAYEGGGGSFLLIYLFIVVLLGIPLMLTELALGRASQTNIVNTFKKLGYKQHSWVGWIGVIGAFIITCYYSHVGGWVLRYVFSYAFEAPAIYRDSLGYFYNMLGLHADGTTSIPWTALFFAALFMLLNAVVIIRGVEGGIEKFNKFGMPALFLLLIILLVRSVTLPGAEAGVKYMLSLDLGKVTVNTFFSALGQAFYSLSIGMAILVTYGSYLSKSEDMIKNTAVVCGMDTLVAVLAGFIIVPAVFATLGSGEVGKGGGFAFVSLAGVFAEMPGGRIFGVLFYLLLLFAALTSCISLIESIVAFLTEEFGWTRKRTTIILCLILFLIGWAMLGHKFAASVAIGTFVYPTFLGIFQSMDVLTHLVDDPLLAAICAGVLNGVGLGLVIRVGGSTGGTDIPAIILNRKLGWKVAPILYISDVVIFLIQIPVTDTNGVILGILYALIYSVVMNKLIVMEQGGIQLMIFTEKVDEVNEKLLSMGFGTTLLNGAGGYMHDDKKVIYCVASTRNLNRIKRAILQIDSTAFITITSISEINGNGFTWYFNQERYVPVLKNRHDGHKTGEALNT